MGLPGFDQLDQLASGHDTRLFGRRPVVSGGLRLLASC